MPSNKGVVSIGLNVDYQKSLQEMTNAFKTKLTELSNEFKKVGFAKDVTQQFDAVYKKIDSVSSELKAMFSSINNGKLDASQFEQYQIKITKEFGKIEKSISNLTGQISSLDDKFKMLDGSDFASGIKKQFDDLRDSVLGVYEDLSKVVDFAKTSSSSSFGGIDVASLDKYKSSLAEIRRAYKEIDNLNFERSSDDDLFENLSKQEELLNKQINTYKELKSVMSSTSQTSPEYSTLENELVRAQIAAVKTSETIQALDQEIATRNLGAGMEDDTQAIIGAMSKFDDEIDEFTVKAQKMIQRNKEIQNSVEQTQTAFNTFQIKNGAIHVPVEIATKNGTLQKQLQEAIDKLQDYAQKNSIIAKVRLVLDGDSSKGYKKNSDIAKQLENSQNEPSINIGQAIKKTYVQSVREAEKVAKEAIKSIQTIFNGNPIKITPDKDTFIKELSEMVNSSLGKIANESSGLNVNEGLKGLVASLKEVSNSLSGNEGFKLGLDESSINRITSAIDNMANMIKRAFNVASDEDISSQWTVIEEKFKSVAGEAGKIDGRNKANIQSMRELAAEYKKYLDMGGTNELSALTKHKPTVNNLTKAYEQLGRTVQEVSQKQERQKTSSRKSTADFESIKSTTKANKSLEIQAGKTSTAIESEGKSAQSTSEKFRKLAKEKGAAVVANRELAKAAKETADALERETKTRKETGVTKQSKNAVNEATYANNFLKWQNEIKQSLLDSGNYAEVYDAKINQSANGTVKFTAVVRDLDGALKKFSATVKDSGKISTPSISDMSEKQAASFEKNLIMAERVREVMATMDSEGVEPTVYNKSEMEGFVSSIIKATDELGDFNTKYKVAMNSQGGISITREFRDASGELQTFTAKFASIDSVIDTTTGEVRNLSEVLENAFSATASSSKTDELISKYKEVHDVAKRLNSLDVKIAGLDVEKNASQVKELREQYDSLEDTYSRLVHELVTDVNFGSMPVEDVKKLNDIFEETDRKIDEIRAKFDDVQRNITKGFNDKALDAFNDFEHKWIGDANFDSIKGDLDSLRTKFANVGDANTLKDLKQGLSDIETKLKNMKANASLGSLFKGNNQTFNDINEVRNSLNSLFAIIGKVNEKSIRVKNMKTLTADIKKANGEIHKMTVNLDKDGFARYVDNGIVQFGRLRVAAEGVFKGIQQMVRIYLSPQDFIRYFRQGFDMVKEVDTAMTELRKVSDASNGDLASYFDDAVVSAKELGSSVNDMISATADWSRNGYNLPDSKELAEVAVLYKNVGDGINIEEANSSLVSTLQGFQMDASEAIDIVDKFNEVIVRCPLISKCYI